MPGRTASDLQPDTVARLAELPGVVGIKEATGNMCRASELISRLGDRMAILSGDDFTMFPLYALGGRGVISVVSNVAPKATAELWDAAVAGNWVRARELHYKLMPLVELLFQEPSPAPVKAALSLAGKMSDELRPPLYTVAPALRDKLRAAMLGAGLL